MSQVNGSSISPAAAFSVADAFAGKRILATGVSGFVGKVWLAYLLDRVEDVAEVRVVIRPKKGKSAKERFETIIASSPVFRPMRERLGVRIWDLVDEKIRVCELAIAEPGCGLSTKERESITKDIDVVVHFAGLVDFEPDPCLAIDANIHGAWNVADLAAETPGKRYVHVSTAFVAGAASGRVQEDIRVGISPNGTKIDPHAELATIEAFLKVCEKKKDRIDYVQERAQSLGWPNIYTFTKALSEQLIATRSDIRAATVRPAIVECARDYPFVGWNEGVNTSGPLVWLLSTAFQRLPANPSLNFDVIPVDDVVRGTMLATAATLMDQNEEIYHCASSDLNPMKLKRAIELTALANRQQHAKSDCNKRRHVMKRLDPYAVDGEREQILGYQRVREVARATRTFLRKNKFADWLPPKLQNKTTERLDDSLREFSMQCRTADRKFGQIEEMLRQYQPFICQYNYTFQTKHLLDISQMLSEKEREIFGFSVDFCWRDYWLNVQVPGLEEWCIPILKGDKVPCDEPLPRPKRTIMDRTPAVAE